MIRKFLMMKMHSDTSVTQNSQMLANANADEPIGEPIDATEDAIEDATEDAIENATENATTQPIVEQTTVTTLEPPVEETTVTTLAPDSALQDAQPTYPPEFLARDDNINEG